MILLKTYVNVIGIQRHFQQYFSYFVAVRFNGGVSEVPGCDHRTGASQ